MQTDSTILQQKDKELGLKMGKTSGRGGWFCRSVDNSCDPMDCSLPGSSDLETSKARILEWVAIPFSRGLSRIIAGGFLWTEPPGKLKGRAFLEDGTMGRWGPLEAVTCPLVTNEFNSSVNLQEGQSPSPELQAQHHHKRAPRKTRPPF